MIQEITEAYRLSPQQARLWSILDGNNTWLVQAALSITGALDRARLRRCLEEIVQRHEILRTRIAVLPETGLPAQFASHTGPVVGVAFHPSQPVFVTAGADKTVKLWDLAAGKELKTLATLPDPITSLAVSRDFTAFAEDLRTPAYTSPAPDASPSQRRIPPAPFDSPPFQPAIGKSAAHQSSAIRETWRRGH